MESVGSDSGSKRGVGSDCAGKGGVGSDDGGTVCVGNEWWRWRKLVYIYYLML